MIQVSAISADLGRAGDVRPSSRTEPRKVLGISPTFRMSADATDPDLTCAICLEPYVEPLTLQCGHSFCRACLLQSTKLAPDGRSCPQCRAVIDDIADLRHHAANESLEAKVSAAVPAAKLDERRAQAARTLDALAQRNAGVYPVFIMRCAVGPRPGERVRVGSRTAERDPPRALPTYTTLHAQARPSISTSSSRATACSSAARGRASASSSGRRRRPPPANQRCSSPSGARAPSITRSSFTAPHLSSYTHSTRTDAISFTTIRRSARFLPDGRAQVSGFGAERVTLQV